MTQTSRHVFVDASGRRQAWLRRCGGVLTALLTAYLVLLVAALVGPPGLTRLTVPGLGSVLPDSGPAQLDVADGEVGSPQDALEEGPARPTATPSSNPSPASGVDRSPRPSAPVSSAPTTAVTATPTRPGNRPSTPPGQASPTSSPTPTPTAQGGRPTEQPTPRGSGRPTRTPRP